MTPDPRALKASLSRTWPAFFAGHGAFTEVQRRAIPVILSGQDSLVVAATASGKTEAAVAPLVERRVLGVREGGLRLLYICPTRALVRDLYERLAPPLRAMGISLAMKSGDTGPVSHRRPPAVLITTPESTDSLLTRAPRLMSTLAAVVLDEIHLFDRSARGDHLRCLLRRIEAIRCYAEPEREPAQRVALSATVAEPEDVARRYLNDPAVVQVAGGRALEPALVPMYDLDDLAAALSRRAARKTLVFCNTRHEVEQVATYLRASLTFEAPVFVHYSNLDPSLRREVEARFAEASVALCVSSSTLELGIDIGSIDEVALVGPPPTISSFLQRIGRGGRRGKTTRVLCFARAPAETLRFGALLASRADAAKSAPGYRFRPAVLVQQVFSLLKQSPTGGVRLADVQRVAPDEVAEASLRQLLEHLAATGYLTPGRPREWRAGPKLNELSDEHELYSNIGGEELGATIIDAYSGRPIGRGDRPRRQGETLLMGGRSVEVAWQDRYKVGVQPVRGGIDEMMRFHTAPVAIPLDVAQGVAAQLGLKAGQVPCLSDERGVWLFHFWGDLYGDLLAASLRAYFTPEGEEGEEPLVASWNELCLYVPFPLTALPPYDEALVKAQVERLAAYFGHFLELGRFHPLLPPELATQSVIEQLELPRFKALYRSATLHEAPAGLREALRTLL